MPLHINIVDPNSLSKKEIHQLVRYLLGVIGEEFQVRFESPPLKDANVISPDIREQLHQKAKEIHTPLGMDAECEIDPRAIFGKNKLEPVDVNTSIEPTILPTTTAAGEIEVDVAGLPWDGRIHSRSKSKTKDGLWRVQRGLHDSVYEKVMAELKQTMAVPLPPSFAKPEIVVPIAPLTPADIAAMSPINPPISAPTVPREVTFNDFILKVTMASNSGKIDRASIGALVNKHGVPSIALLANRPDLLPAINAEFDRLVA